MTAPDATELELRRLARLLKVPTADLEELRPVPPEDLKTLRDQIAGRLFDAGADSFKRAAKVGHVVPAPLAAKLAEHALGPVLAARTTAVADPEMAVQLSKRFSPAFLADVAEELDPRIVDDLVLQLPPEVIADVSVELERREEWLVMADFVGHVSHEALAVTMNAMSVTSILRVSELLEDRSRLDEIVAMLNDDRLAEMREVAEREGLEELLEDLVGSLSGQQRARIVPS